MIEIHDTKAYCELTFSPNQYLVAPVRRFVGEFYERVLGDPDVTSRLVVTTHELLENSVRYAADGLSSIRIEVQRVGEAAHVVVSTRNRARDDNRNELRSLLEGMQSTGRAEFYQQLMRKSSTRLDGSGLGLGRIHAESEMDLTCDFDGEFVALRAEGRFPSKEPT